MKNLTTISLLILAIVIAKRGPLLAPAVESPIAEPGLHVLIVEETANRSPEVGAVINSAKLQSLVGPGHWRIVDPVDDQGNPTDLSKLEPKWRTAMERERGVLPWVIISNAPHGGYEGPLVASELVARVEEFARLGGSEDRGGQ